MNALYVSGSPRENSNTDWVLERIRAATGGAFVKLVEHRVAPCCSCWACREMDGCVINDDMTQAIIPKLLDADAIILGTPVYFNNVTAQLKCFIDRTWSIRGKLRDKIGATVVVGRRYGAEGAITALNSFFLKHEMIVANRGISGIAFEPGEIREDAESMAAATRLGSRIVHLHRTLG